MDHLDRLEKLFVAFPGIGSRQARRFVYFLLGQGKPFIDRLISALADLNKDVTQCTKCLRYFTGAETQEERCGICIDKSRDQKILMIVAKEVDLENVEQSGAYSGSYFVLGGILPLAESKGDTGLRLKELRKYIDAYKPEEIILAFSTNPEGENTADVLSEKLAKSCKKISRLGRGLSTGAEIEYSDPETLKNALESRV